MPPYFLPFPQKLAALPVKLPSLSDDGGCEVTELAARQVQVHGLELAKASCLLKLTAALFAASGLANFAQGAALLALRCGTVSDCVVRQPESQELSAEALYRAVAGLQRAAETARYLVELPD